VSGVVIILSPSFPLLATRVSHPSPQHRDSPMILRHREASSLWVLLLLISAARSQPDEECHISIRDDMYDFSALKGDHIVSRTRSLPPTNMRDTLRFNICKELSPLGDVDSNDQVRIPWRPRKTLTDDFGSAPAGRGSVLARQISNRESQTELLPLFLLHKNQSCRYNTESCRVRSSSPLY
jgi:Autophagy-related protein 27